MTGEVAVKLSDEWWELHPTYTRCKATNRTGERCRRYAKKGSVVCTHHGAAAPQVRKKAAERIIMAADDAASRLIQWMSDESKPFKERRLIAQDLLDRANLAGKQLTEVTVQHQWETVMEDVMIVEVDVSNDSDDAVDAPEPLDDHYVDPDSETVYYPPKSDPVVVDAEIVEDQGASRASNDSTPPRHLRALRGGEDRGRFER